MLVCSREESFGNLDFTYFNSVKNRLFEKLDSVRPVRPMKRWISKVCCCSTFWLCSGPLTIGESDPALHTAIRPRLTFRHAFHPSITQNDIENGTFVP